jgi:hypothetical protein
MHQINTHVCICGTQLELFNHETDCEKCGRVYSRSGQEMCSNVSDKLARASELATSAADVIFNLFADEVIRGVNPSSEALPYMGLVVRLTYDAQMEVGDAIALIKCMNQQEENGVLPFSRVNNVQAFDTILKKYGAFDV